MKRKIKLLIGAAAVSSLAAFATGCDLVDWVDKEIEQARCEHVFDEGIITEEATCTATGEKLFTCAICGETETRDIEMLPHTEIPVESVSATCTETGLTDGVKCEVCDMVIVEQSVIPATGHNERITAGTSATCTTSGLTAEKYCIACETVLQAHTIIPATGHNVMTVAGYKATCLTDGLTNGSMCTNCGETYAEQEVIPAYGHDYVNGICTLCGDAPGMIVTMYPTGYMLETPALSENVLGNVYCLGTDSEISLLSISCSVNTHVFPVYGDRINSTDYPVDSNAVFFEDDGRYYVQFPSENFTYTYLGKTYTDNNVEILSYSYSDGSYKSYDYYAGRVVSLENHYAQWVSYDYSSISFDGSSVTFDGLNSGALATPSIYDRFELSFEFTEALDEGESFYFAFGVDDEGNNLGTINFEKDKVSIYNPYAESNGYEAYATYTNSSTAWKFRVSGNTLCLFDSNGELLYSKPHALGDITGCVWMSGAQGSNVTLDNVIMHVYS